MALDINPLLQKLNEIDELAKTTDDDLYSKITLVKSLCENRLKNVYAELLPQNDINHLQNVLNELNNHIQNYKSGNAYLPYIANAINAIVSTISKIPTVGVEETNHVLTDIINNFVQRNADVVKNITDDKNNFAKEIEALKKNIDDLSNDVTKKEQEVSSLTTEFHKQFSDAQENRMKEFTNKGAEQDKQFNANVQEFSNKAQITLDEMSNIKKKIEDIYGIVGKSSIVDTQKTYADIARAMANRLQIVSFILMFFVGLLLIVFIYNDLSTNELDWSKFLFKFSISSVLLLPAFLMANEGKRQREKENQYRELEIKMAAITPYFLEINNVVSKENEKLSEKDKVKLELAKKLLSPSKPKSAKNDKYVALSSDTLEKILKILETAKN